MKCGMKLLLQTSTVQPLKFGIEWVISSHTLLDMWLLSKMGPWYLPLLIHTRPLSVLLARVASQRALQWRFMGAMLFPITGNFTDYWSGHQLDGLLWWPPTAINNVEFWLAKISFLHWLFEIKFTITTTYIVKANNKENICMFTLCDRKPPMTIKEGSVM